MNSIARIHEPVENLALPANRAELVRFLSVQCRRVRADHYLIAELAAGHGEDETRIIASNWMFDTVEALGPSSLVRLAGAPLTGFMSLAPAPWRPRGLDLLTDEQSTALADAGHAEFVSARLRAGTGNYFVMMSAANFLALDTDRIPAAMMSLSYAISALGNQLSADNTEFPISERERECLGWVSEGKTTMDIAMILGVSANTINSYLANVIQKLSARNRAMAIAVAIRNGII